MKAQSIPVWVCVCLFVFAALPLLVFNYDHGRAFSDQLNYHYPTILHFVNGGGIADYPSATTPGYHLLLASFAYWVSGTELALKLANCAMTAILLGLIARSVSQVGDTAVSICMLLPVVFSIYIFPSGVWLLPDNLAWLTVFCLLCLALHFRDDWRWYLLVCLNLVAAVLVRQSNLWLCAVVLVAAWSGRGPDQLGPQSRRLIRVATATLTVLPSICALLYFVSIWHGLAPPSFAARHTVLNPAAVPFFFCVLFFYGVFYLPLIFAAAYRRLSESRRDRYLVWLGGLGGLLTSLITPTDWNPSEGRTSGLWNLAKMLPDIHHRSASISALATLGGMLAALWLLMAEPGTRKVIAAAAAGFVAAQTTSHFVYERYYAGLVFILILLLTANMLQGRGEPLPRWTLAGVCTFAIVNAAVLAAGLVPG